MRSAMPLFGCPHVQQLVRLLPRNGNTLPTHRFTSSRASSGDVTAETFEFAFVQGVLYAFAVFRA